MEKVKVISEIRMGAGFDLMCLALAGAVAVDGIIKWKKWRREDDRYRILKTANEAIKTCDELIKKCDKYVKKDVEEVVKENGES